MKSHKAHLMMPLRDRFFEWGVTSKTSTILRVMGVLLITLTYLHDQFRILDWMVGSLLILPFDSLWLNLPLWWRNTIYQAPFQVYNFKTCLLYSWVLLSTRPGVEIFAHFQLFTISHLYGIANAIRTIYDFPSLISLVYSILTIPKSAIWSLFSLFHSFTFSPFHPHEKPILIT